VKGVLLDEKKHIRFADWSANDVSCFYAALALIVETFFKDIVCQRNFLIPQIEILNKYLFLTSKPIIYLVNLSEKDYIRKKNKW
jgi:obg-like ATPase 1